MKIGYFLSCEEFAPAQLIAHARAAEKVGFHGLWISDHFHPWNDEQGESPFVWSVIGALAEATARVPVTTAVTCPTIRIHPAIIAQAAATSAVMLEGRFNLGVGSGEALNEQIVATDWPAADERLEMLEEAIEVMRALWSGDVVHHRGRHYEVRHARIYTRPDEPPPVLMSGFGPKATDLAARVADGYCTTGPDSELIGRFRDGGGQGKPVHAGAKVCSAPDEAEARRTAYRIWPNESLPGELAQVLSTPEHFMQAAELVTEDMVAESVPCGPDIERHVEWFREYEKAGVDELYVHQIGAHHDEFFERYRRDVLPNFG